MTLTFTDIRLYSRIIAGFEFFLRLGLILTYIGIKRIFKNEKWAYRELKFHEVLFSGPYVSTLGGAICLFISTLRNLLVQNVALARGGVILYLLFEVVEFTVVGYFLVIAVASSSFRAPLSAWFVDVFLLILECVAFTIPVLYLKQLLKFEHNPSEDYNHGIIDTNLVAFSGGPTGDNLESTTISTRPSSRAARTIRRTGSKQSLTGWDRKDHVEEPADPGLDKLRKIIRILAVVELVIRFLFLFAMNALLWHNIDVDSPDKIHIYGILIFFLIFPCLVPIGATVALWLSTVEHKRKKKKKSRRISYVILFLAVDVTEFLIILLLLVDLELGDVPIVKVPTWFAILHASFLCFKFFADIGVIMYLLKLSKSLNSKMESRRHHRIPSVISLREGEGVRQGQGETQKQEGSKDTLLSRNLQRKISSSALRKK